MNTPSHLGTSIDPDGATDGSDPWEGATPLDPDGQRDGFTDW